MKQANGDHKVAKAYYVSWVPEEPVEKWTVFAARWWAALKGGARSLAKVIKPKKPGPKPRLSDELAIKIGTVYSQRLHWEHGQSRHYKDMEEVNLQPRPTPLPPQPGWDTRHPTPPLANNATLSCVASGLPPPPCAEGTLLAAWHEPCLHREEGEGRGPRLQVWGGAHQAGVQ